MKVCMLTDAYYPSVGGVETHIISLSNELAKLGNSVTVITHFPLQEGKTLVPPGLHQNVEVIRIKCKAIRLNGADPVVDPAILSRLYTVIKNADCDIVHGHSLLSLFVLQGLKAAKKLGIPTVVTKHSTINQRNLLKPIAKLYLPWISHTINSLSNALVGVSKACIKELPSIRIPTYYVPNGVNSQFRIYPLEIRQTVRQEIGILSDDIPIGYFGRLVKRKGILDLLKMFPHIKKILPKAKLVIIGCGPLESYLKRFIQDNPELGLIYLGKKSYDEMPKYFQAIDIFAFPSYGEGLPIAVLESLASGVPVVAYHEVGIEEVITSGEEAFFVNNPFDFIEKVILLAKDRDLRARMGVKGASLINSKYRWHHIAKELLNIYSQSCIKRIHSGG